MTLLSKYKRLIVALWAVSLALVAFFILVIVPMSDKSNWMLVVGVLSCLTMLLLPFFTAGLMIALFTRRQALLILGGLSVVSLLGFVVWGVWFLFLLPVWIGFMIPAARRTWWSWVLAILIVVLGIGLFLPCLGQPATYVSKDLSNVQQISVAIRAYRKIHGQFPDRLSQLQEVTDSLMIFASPRRRRDWCTHGPLRIWLDKTDPGPPRVITSWSQVDGGDYLYRKPPEDATATTIIVMTRPGLLDRNWITVGLVDGHVEMLKLDFQTSRADVLEFLKQTGAVSP
jgi:hypothetical protein